MNAKKYFVAVIVLGTGLLGFGALIWQTQHGGNCLSKALTGPSGKFGPKVETVLRDANTQSPANLVDLETGRALVQPSLDRFKYRAEAIVGWIRANGLDISCFVWSGRAACVTYDMTIVAVEGKCWEETSEGQLFDNPALAPGQPSPRRLLVLGPNRPDTFMFRTREGTLGMLRIVGVVGLGQHAQGVKICYKLINPAKSLSVAL